ncbi:OX-2 membrane glycoprotein isoform X1 [Ictalurus punctatus]|uniref:OX-2 membrane glycoprotein isoform X1 n=1 Tax=Ictalurus punctatus TaxID=7998 RepID=A0A2D0Q548_ICTPU|nr:OX-2 membrane glycoprotein isoform X1 [Ictalurus punctatus]
MFRVIVLDRRNTMLDYSVFLSLFTLACSAGILKREDLNVSLGQDATFSCELPGAVGVKQVIWQQHRDDGTLRNMVTFTERSKPQVDDAFLGKVTVTVASVHTTTIVIKNVTFSDEACYVCTFSVYPSGTERETACLTVQGLSEITTQLPVKLKEKDTVVACSATGKPTPVFSWWSGEKELSNYLSETFTVLNGDSTVTTTSNLTIPQSQFSGKYVTCVANSGNIEKSENITVEKQIDKGTPVTSRSYVFSAVVMISCVVSASCVIILFHQKRKKHQKHLIEVA